MENKTKLRMSFRNYFNYYIRTGYSKHWKSNTPRYISFHHISCVNKPHVIKYASRMQAQKDYFRSAFFTFIFLWFTRLYLFCPLFLFFFKFTCVEFQVRIMLHFAYSIFYIKPQTISVCFELVCSFVVVFCNWWNGGILLNLNKINILAEWRQTDKLSTLFNIRHPGIVCLVTLKIGKTIPKKSTGYQIYFLIIFILRTD